jgi:hypothetical protein
MVCSMAQYKNGQYLHQNNHTEFDNVYAPGTNAPNSGIYRCTNCGDEDACNKGNPLPPQNHRQHNPANGAIRWQLLVFAQQG